MRGKGPSRTLTNMLVLLGVSVACAAVARFAYDTPLPLDYAWDNHVEKAAAELGMPTVSVDEAEEIAQNFTHIILDARRYADYEAGRLPGAMSLPLTDFDDHFASVAPLLSDGMPVMVYCSGIDCDESLKLGEILIKGGYSNVVLFAGGMTAWTNAGHAVEQ